MRRTTWLLALGIGLAGGCDPNARTDAAATDDDTTPTAGTDRDTPVRDIVEGNAETQKLVEKLGLERVDDPFAPSARGGGPAEPLSARSDHRYSESSAVAVLSSARCGHALECSRDNAGCEHEAAALHGPQVAACHRGVRAAALHDCASEIRSATCPAMTELPASCLAAALCGNE